MSKSILLTRSIESNEELKVSLYDKNFDFLDCALIEHSLLFVTSEYINKFSRLIITSNFSAKHVPDSPHANTLAWVVGKKSADILRKKGYRIEYCAHNAENLKANLSYDEERSILYLSGDHITVDMPSFVTRKIMYNTKYLKSLSSLQVERYKKGIDYIVLYSENCAKTLLKLLIENNLVKYLEKSTIIAISSKVGNVFKQLFRNVVICSSSDSMLSYIKKCN